MKNLVILISGRGSNLAALLDACAEGTIHGRVVAVVSNRPEAGGLAIAARHGITTRVVDHRAYPTRDAFDQALAEAIRISAPDLILLAGFMRILTPGFVEAFAGRIVNIHPSLLPAFPGLDTHARALAAGVDTHGASVHFVTADLDAGPVLLQAHIGVRPGDTAESLQARVLEAEHRLYPEAVRLLCNGEVEFREGCILQHGSPLTRPLVLTAPEGSTDASHGDGPKPGARIH